MKIVAHNPAPRNERESGHKRDTPRPHPKGRAACQCTRTPRNPAKRALTKARPWARQTVNPARDRYPMTRKQRRRKELRVTAKVRAKSLRWTKVTAKCHDKMPWQDVRADNGIVKRKAQQP